MLAVVGREIAQAVEQGYPAVRITADMSWVLDQPDGYLLLLACEAGFEEAIAPDTEMMAICQLDRGRCAPDHLQALHATHQIRVTANPSSTMVFSASPAATRRRACGSRASSIARGWARS